MLCQAGRVTFSYLADFGHVITFECTMHRVSMQNERGAEAPNTKVRRKAMWGLCGENVYIFFFDFEISEVLAQIGIDKMLICG